ncbi:adenosylcobinamide amidohydrolase [Bacterioplanoides sp. SCSIO 12839]|uniref:adenosylcobinamide amidohydrolase n=1 Tax=Bacterioplanoides sp. SCSIO 12839 TaxID=2829569 RepID=UPI0021035FAA|nr:adenosylcobinamide amidohydrolase [Bacterioplanoides sp. SCSIO 12839]UTW48831.1 adenosylcobinamide amidohydrolase [Bacterioplanoides sp. SCSIO 12839]
MNLLKTFLLLFTALALGCSTLSRQPDSSEKQSPSIKQAPSIEQPAVPNKSPSMGATNWTSLQDSDQFNAYRYGRFFLVELKQPHRVISTSAYNGGEKTDLKYLINHQSMEARADMRWVNRVLSNSKQQYQQLIADELALNPNELALMGTAANMQLLAHQQAVFQADDAGALIVDVYATAGVRGNAMRAGDPTRWYETPTGNKKHTLNQTETSQKNDMNGTINIMVLINQPVSSGAMNKLQIIATEAKSAALHELAISSRYSRHLATGTGTDQMIIASPLAPKNAFMLESGSGHLKLGELVGTAVRQAVKQALVWQNGLPAAEQANIFNALGRFGLNEKNFIERLSAYLPEPERQQASNNPYAFSHENRVVAAAYAFASVLDRFEYQTLTPHIQAETLRDFAAQAAVALSGRSDRYSEYWQQLQAPAPVNVTSEAAATELFIQALALGWLDKWPDHLLSPAISEHQKATGDKKANDHKKTIAFLHLDPQLGDLAGNTALLKQAMIQAAQAGADWILTPELALSGYRFTLAIGDDWIQPAPDRWTAELQQLADELDVVLFLSHVEQVNNGNKYNTLFVINRDGQIIGKHHKIQTIPVSEAWSTKGTKPQLVTVDEQQIGLLICADAYRPQHAQALKDAGAELIISSANWAPGDYGPGDSWRNRSKETDLPVFVNNRTGLEVRPEVDGKVSQFDLRQAISAVAYQGEHRVEHQSRHNSLLLVEWDFALQQLISQKSVELQP